MSFIVTTCKPFLYTYTYMCIRTRNAYTHTDTHTHTHMHTHMHSCTHAHTHIHIHIHMYTCACTCTYAYMHGYTYSYTHIQTHIHMHIRRCTRAHIYIHICNTHTHRYTELVYSICLPILCHYRVPPEAITNFGNRIRGGLWSLDAGRKQLHRAVWFLPRVIRFCTVHLESHLLVLWFIQQFWFLRVETFSSWNWWIAGNTSKYR